MSMNSGTLAVVLITACCRRFDRLVTVQGSVAKIWEWVHWGYIYKTVGEKNKREGRVRNSDKVQSGEERVKERGEGGHAREGMEWTRERRRQGDPVECALRARRSCSSCVWFFTSAYEGFDFHPCSLSSSFANGALKARCERKGEGVRGVT